MGPHQDFQSASARLPTSIKRLLPLWMRKVLSRLYWLIYDAHDFFVETLGWIPFHSLRMIGYQHMARVHVGQHTSLHRGCRFYRASGVTIGEHSIINREVLLDGRMGLIIGNNVSISEGVAIFTLEHDPNSPTFGDRGAPVTIGDRVFIGARAMILPGVIVNEGAVVAAGAVVTRDVAPYTIVGGVPAKPIGQRRQDLDYTLNYRKFLG